MGIAMKEFDTGVGYLDSAPALGHRAVREKNRPDRGSNPGQPHNMRGALPLSYLVGMLEGSTTLTRARLDMEMVRWLPPGNLHCLLQYLMGWGSPIAQTTDLTL